MSIHLNNRKELEHHFADHFDTPVFPVLAEMYFQQNDLRRARKVCEIGLEHHPDSVDGRFIVARIELVNKNLAEAERHLKYIAENSMNHIQALRLLFEVQNELERSVKTIRNTVDKILDIYPDDEAGLRWLEDNREKLNEADVTEEPSEKKATEVKPRPTDTPSRTGESGLTINKRMATVTLARVFKRQKNYSQALEVLKMVREKGGDIKVAEREEKEIKKLMWEQEKPE